MTHSRCPKTLVLLAAFASAVSADAKRQGDPAPEPCRGGRFINCEAIVGDGDNICKAVFEHAGNIADRAIEITACSRHLATVSIPSCGTVRARLSVRKNKTQLATKWLKCSGFEGRVKLTGRMRRATCGAFKGRLLHSNGKQRVTVVRSAQSRCGDKIVDPFRDEQCDTGPGCDSTCQGPATGGTGAFGIVLANGLQKMYLPQVDRNTAGHGVVAVVDVGVPGGGGSAGTPALITDIDLGTPDQATATGGNSGIIVATSTESRTVWFIDPKTDKVTGTLTLDDTFRKTYRSGGLTPGAAEGAFVTGVAVAGGQAILSVWNGFALVDLAARTITGSIIAAPSENFGFDGSASLIIAPFYACGNNQPLAICGTYVTRDGEPITDGLNIIDLADHKVYTVQDQDEAGDPTKPLGDEPDAAAADPALNVAVVTPEGRTGPNSGPLRIFTLAQAKFDREVGIVTAPRKLAAVPGGLRLTGVAIETMRHYAFLEQEFADGVGVLKLDDFLSDRASLVTATMPVRPDANPWTNMGDPHGIAVTTGLDGDQSLGFLVDIERRWVARVDLAKFAGGGQNLKAAVTFLDARTPRPILPALLCKDLVAAASGRGATGPGSL
jgi:hypothetical protein